MILPTAMTNGLIGTYFNNRNSSSYSFTRFDSNVSFTWGSGSPDSTLDVDPFSARWTGQIQVPATGT